MQNPIFTGVCTALVTPFLNGTINYPMVEQLIRRQILAGIEAIVLSGTTGESATLSSEEKLELFAKGKQYSRNRCKILAGTGSNSTQKAVALSIGAEKAGADGLLVVSPYYNKATPEGILMHYRAIAQSVHIPIIVYNVPSRTGLDIPVSVYQELAEISNIIGVKEASPDVSKILKIRANCPSDFFVWSGNDDLTVPILSLGGRGVISVTSNIHPELMQAMTKAALDGDFDTAASLQVELQPLTETLFQQVNPIPVKAAMKLIGYDCGPCRLPLTQASMDVVTRLSQLLHK